MTNKKHISNHLYAYNVTRATYSPHVKPCAHVDHFAHHTHLVPLICTDYLPHTTLFITIDGHCLLFGLAYTTFYVYVWIKALLALHAALETPISWLEMHLLLLSLAICNYRAQHGHIDFVQHFDVTLVNTQICVICLSIL